MYYAEFYFEILSLVFVKHFHSIGNLDNLIFCFYYTFNYNTNITLPCYIKICVKSYSESSVNLGNYEGGISHR